MLTSESITVNLDSVDDLCSVLKLCTSPLREFDCEEGTGVEADDLLYCMQEGGCSF